ncbi:MAG: phasin family protein [Bacteroidota bacterium]
MATQTNNPYVQQVEELVERAIIDLRRTAKTASQTALDASEAVRKTTLDVLRAGVGAYLAVAEETTKTYTNLVARGEEVEWPQQLVERPRAFVQEQFTRFEKQSEEAVEAVKAQTEELTGAVEAQAEEGKKLFEKTAKDLQTQVEKAVAEALHRIGMPTRQDVQTLQATVAKLNKQVDDLRKA